MTLKLDVKITGLGTLVSQLEKTLPNEAKKQTLQNIKFGVTFVHGETVRAIQSHSMGTNVIRYSPKRRHVASKPGSAPNTDSGRLVSSYKFFVDASNIIGFVGSNLKYAKILEFGSRVMKKRPALGPAFNKYKKLLRKAFKISFKGKL